jgi:hypothetical protein
LESDEDLQVAALRSKIAFAPLRRLERCATLALERSLPGARSSVCREQAVRAGVAQLVEHLICNQRVGGSSPFASSSPNPGRGICRTRHMPNVWAVRHCKDAPVLFVPGHPSPLSPPFRVLPAFMAKRRVIQRRACDGHRGAMGWNRAQVAERLMAADCKSAAPCELRRFESSPVHQKLAA